MNDTPGDHPVTAAIDFHLIENQPPNTMIRMTQDGILGAAAGKSVWDSLQECGTRTHGAVVAPAPANGLAFWPKWSGAIDDSS